MAVFNEPSQWGTSLVVNGDTNVIPQSTPAGSGALSFDDGFPQITQVPLGAGGIAPDRKDFNAVMKLLGDAVFYMQNGGFWSYNSAFDYAVGRVVLYTDGNLYKCIQANGASSTVVAPDSVSPLGLDYWVQVATLADFANYANTDFSNINNTAKEAIAHNAMPSDTYDVLTPASSTPYTAPADGYVIARTSGGNQASVAIRIGVGYITNNFNATGGGDMFIYAPVKKGEVFTIDVNLTTVQSLLFVYAVGSESEQV